MTEEEEQNKAYKELVAREEKALEKGIEEVKAILKKHDIRMSVGSDGDEPAWVAFEYKGKWIIRYENLVDFDMFDDRTSQ